MGVLTEGPHREIYLMVKGSTMLKAGRMVWKSKVLFYYLACYIFFAMDYL